MRAFTAVCVAGFLAVPLAGTAVADPGGVPNPNAVEQTGNGSPQGRKGECLVPGVAIRQTAQGPGPNEIFGPPGQSVRQCTPAGP